MWYSQQPTRATIRKTNSMKIFSAIIKYSLENRFLVLVCALITAFYGAYCAKELPVDILPDLDKTIATIVAEVPGMAPEEIETLVSIPLETALNGLNGVTRVRAANTPSLCLITLEFDWKTDPYKIRQLIQERLQSAIPSLPSNVQPIIAPISSVMGEIMILGLSTDNPNISPIDLRTIADYTVARRLSNISGISQVLSTGGGLKQYRIIPDTAKMASLGVTLEEVENAASAAQSNTGGGIVNRGGVEVSVRNIGRSASVDDISNAVVKAAANGNILLKDVAEVRIDKAQLRGDAAVNGKPGIIITVSKQPGVDTIKVTKALDAAIAEIQKGLPENTRINVVYRQDDFIKKAVDNVEDAIVDGSVMVFVVLLAFLFNVRTTFITITAIPLSLAIALIYFKLTGSTINTMTLGGLAVAIGMLVDDAIVDVENVYRRLRENRNSQSPKTHFNVILDACVEIRASIFYATALIIIVFIPTFGLSGIEGKMFAPLSEAVLVSMAASFLVALTVIPALCSLMLGKVGNSRKEPIFSRAAKWIISKFAIVPSIRHPHAALAFAAMLAAAAFAFFPVMGRDFIPPLNEGSCLLIVQLSPDSSIDRSKEMGQIVQKILAEIPEVKSTGMKIGRAEKDDHAEPVNIVKFNIDFDTSIHSQSEILKNLRDKLDHVAGITYSIGQPMAHRIDYMLSGTQSQIAVKIFGEDLSVLREKSEELAGKIKNLNGAKDVNVEKQAQTAQIKIRVDRQKAKLYGVQVGKINDILQTILGGKAVAQVVDKEAIFDVFLRMDEGLIASKDKLEEILVENISGEKYPLSSFAEIENSAGANHINREGLKRRVAVGLNTSDGDSVRLAGEIREIIDHDLNLPAGYYANIEGQFQNRIDAGRRIGILFCLAMLAIFALLYTHFKSAALVLQIMLGIPAAFAGGIFATWYFIGTVSVASLIGMIALSGIAARNTIMMISHYIHLMESEGETFGEHMIKRGTLERVNPILMTALTAALALIPLMFNPESPGKELLYPVSVMIVGGLVSSTLLSVIVTPAAFRLFGCDPTKNARIRQTRN